MTKPVTRYDLSSTFTPLASEYEFPTPEYDGWDLAELADRAGFSLLEYAIASLLFPALGRRPESGLKVSKSIKEMLDGSPVIEEGLGEDTAAMATRMLQMFTAVSNLDAFHETVRQLWGKRGVVRFTPESEALKAYDPVAIDVPLRNGFRLPIDRISELDPESVVVLTAPNGISGYMHPTMEIAALAKYFYLVVLDERHADFSLRKLTPLVAEWENVISLRRYPFDVGASVEPMAGAIHPQSMHGFISGVMPVPDHVQLDVFTVGSMNLWNDATRRTARIKGQLYREMRKLSIVSVPYPSWANYLLVKVERGDREMVVAGLADRGIDVYVPPHANLQQHFRVTALSDEATEALKQALIEINREI